MPDDTFLLVGDAEIIVVRNGPAWAHIFVDEGTRTFVAHGSHGTLATVLADAPPQGLKRHLADLSPTEFCGAFGRPADDPACTTFLQTLWSHCVLSVGWGLDANLPDDVGPV